MHEAVRSVVKSVIQGGTPGEAVEVTLDAAFVEHGLSEHGYVSTYRAIALEMLQFFLATRDEHAVERLEELTLPLAGDLVVVRPDDVLVDGSGRKKLRHVKTGHLRTKEDEDVGAAAFMLAARSTSPGSAIELVHLADKKVTPIELSGKVQSNRQHTMEEIFTNIRDGRFPAKPAAKRCPSCPAFFICGPTPPGRLTKASKK